MRPEDISYKRVLLSPLNWGMGHVSRSIGLVDQLLQQNNMVFIACNMQQQAVYEHYFNDVTFIPHLGYPFHFSGNGNFDGDLMKHYRGLKKRLKREPLEVEEMVETYGIDVVLSDHRYGFISDKVPSIFITHQLNLPLRWFQKGIVGRVHRKLISAFKAIWVMDFEDNRLGGRLSQSNGFDAVFYVGPYSRFSGLKIEEKTIDRVLIVSGPPEYGQLLVNQELQKPENKDAIVIASAEIQIPPGFEVIQNDWETQDAVIAKAKHIVSYAGYSTLMDLEVLQVNHTLYATKGQREQEYLLQLRNGLTA